MLHLERRRPRLLDHFLARPRLFRTDLAYQEGEAQARVNLKGERAALLGGGDPK